MEFIRKLFNRGGSAQQDEKTQQEEESQEHPGEGARGTAPVQTPEEIDSARTQMEAELEEQRARREGAQGDDAKKQE